MSEQENIVKRTCQELGITQKELAEKLGVSVETISKASSSGNVSNQLNTGMLLLIELKNKNEELKQYYKLKEALKIATS